MLEETKMDKKSANRSLQPQSRTSVVDCKKNSELTHKPWPRNNKKREGSGGIPKNEPFRRNPTPQRGRGQVDKRPRARGGSGYVGGTPSTGIDDDDEPEIGSVFVPGSKKQNLNHLLNFMYPSRAGGGPDRRAPIPRRQFKNNMVHRHEQDLYLRAYCQFVVKENGDYVINIMDPDLPMKWEQIEEIVVRSSGRSECPICLGTPSAGRVGVCGHVYCWACVLHYAAAHEKQPPPCPVCATPLNVKEMKPTRLVQWEPPAEEVTMTLVRRLRGSTTVEVAPPRGQIVDAEASILPLERINDAPYAKIFSANKQQIKEILERERKEIENQILAEIDTTEIVYLEQALELLKLKEDTLNSQIEAPKVEGMPVENIEKDNVPTIYEKQEINGNKLDWFDVNEEGAAFVENVQAQLEQVDLGESNLNPDAPAFDLNEHNEEQDQFVFPLLETTLEDEQMNNDELAVTEIDRQNQAKYFYFYQAEDGQQVFLHNLNVRILNASWGTLAAAPPTIRGRVLHRDTLSLDEQMRKHMPYTAHLPLYCSFDVVELDLKAPFVTKDAVKSFADELDRRARVRARHEREERRRERAYRRAVEGPPRPDVSSEVLFPAPSPPTFELLPEPSSPSTSITSPSPGLSFAKMASTSGTWRVRKSSSPPPPPPPEEEGSGAPRALCLSDAIEAALHATPSTSGKKGKKSKQKVLFATGMQRAG